MNQTKFEDGLPTVFLVAMATSVPDFYNLYTFDDTFPVDELV